MAYKAKIPNGTHLVFIQEYIEELSFGSYNNAERNRKKWNGIPKPHWKLGFRPIRIDRDGNHHLSDSVFYSFPYPCYDIDPRSMIRLIVKANPSDLSFIDSPLEYLVNEKTFAQIEYSTYWKLQTLSIEKRSITLSELVKDTKPIIERLSND